MTICQGSILGRQGAGASITLHILCTTVKKGREAVEKLSAKRIYPAFPYAVALACLQNVATVALLRYRPVFGSLITRGARRQTGEGALEGSEPVAYG